MTDELFVELLRTLRLLKNKGQRAEGEQLLYERLCEICELHAALIAKVLKKVVGND